MPLHHPMQIYFFLHAHCVSEIWYLHISHLIKQKIDHRALLNTKQVTKEEFVKFPLILETFKYRLVSHSSVMAPTCSVR